MRIDGMQDDQGAVSEPARWAWAADAVRVGAARLALRLRQELACRRAHQAGQVDRALRLIWWAVTLQLPRHAIYWVRARRARRLAAAAPPDDAAFCAEPPSGKLRLPRAGRPLVSVIVPTYGQVACTVRCLAAIAAHPPIAPIEVIVIDDASGDPEVARLDGIAGIRLLRHARNLGFLRTCNAAAKAAAGAYLLFLNNDTEPRPGWLDAMLDLLRTRPDAGAVGAKLLYPDGRLQEAGGIIWNDATGWNYGRGDDPSRPEYNYVRAVDYCSAAALLVRAELFARLHGFDRCYAPAYCEDSDLAFRLRAIGYQTLYQPRAEVVHIEGASHGTDPSRGGKACQERNRETFIARWADVLASDHVASGTQALRARDRAFGRPVVLIVDHLVPEPDRDAGSCTMRAFIDALLAAGCVVKFWSDCTAPQPGYEADLQQLGVEVRRGGWADFIPWIAANGAALDRVLVSRPELAERYLLPLRRWCRARVAFYGHDLHHVRLRQAAAHDPAMARAARRMLWLEQRVWRQVDAVLYPSREEADRVALLAPAVRALAVPPYAFASWLPPRRPASAPLLLFVAGFAHPPNEDAACWLVRDIMPLVRRRVPAARLAIVGSYPTVRVRALAGGGVDVTANVSADDLRICYAKARVAVVPLRQGAGVKRKVLEALHAGLPLVTTPVGAQGLPGLETVSDVCATAEAFAASVVALLRHDALWQARSRAGDAYARARFSPEALHGALLAALALPAEVTQRGQPLLEIGEQVHHVLQPDMQPHQRSREGGAGGTRDEAGGRQREALVAAPGGADAEQRERLHESVGALD